MYLGFHFFRLLFRKVTYRFGANDLRQVTKSFGKSDEAVVEKARVTEVIRLYTPPLKDASSGHPRTWRTCIVHSDYHGKRKEFFLEGDSEEECEFFSDFVCRWAGVKSSRENTNE